MTNEKSVLLDIANNAEKIYFFFGGISGSLGIPPFEFLQSTGALKCSRVFLRDFSQSWYQLGLPGVGENVDIVCDYIKKIIYTKSPSEIYFIGNSMGGYAALLFGALMGVGNVIAFSPQTFIDPLNRSKFKDHRWQSQLADLYANNDDSKYYDLRVVFSKISTPINVNLHVAAGNKLDMIHVDHISDFRGVKTIFHEFSGHHLVRHLRDRGLLNQIFSDVFK
jgi:hypothetical protein